MVGSRPLGLRVLRLAGGRASDYKTLRLPDADMSQSVRSFIATRGWDLLWLEDVREADARLDVLLAECRCRGMKVIERPTYVCPWLKLEGTWADVWAARSSATRNHLRRKEKKIVSALGPLEIDACAAPGELGRFLEVARDLYVRSKAGTMITSEFLSARGRRFYEEAFAAEFERGRLDVCVLKAGNRPLAFSIAFLNGSTYHYYMAGYDPEFLRSSPGVLHLMRMIERAYSLGMKEFDFMKGDEDYKFQWSDGQRTLRTILIGRPGLVGVCAAGAASAMLDLKHQVRRWRWLRLVLGLVSQVQEKGN